MLIHEYEVLIVGAGGAGMRAALESSQHARTAVLTKLYPTRSHTGAAQGGMSAALANVEDDNWEWHAFDTVSGGDYLVDQDAAEVMCREAIDAVLDLEKMGLPFNRTPDGRIDQRQFGGHTRDHGQGLVRRSCYAADRTGHLILQTLYQNCIKQNVEFFNEFYVLDLLLSEGLTAGVVAYELATGEIHVFRAKAVVLATGGFGKVYKTTSNAHTLTGDGMGIVLRRGLPLEDMEFYQFHPTGMAGLGILLSEAALSEGAILRNGAGERFMERYAPTMKELAPRDVVARCMSIEVREGRGAGPNKDHLLLDLTHLQPTHIDARLPDIVEFARTYLDVEPYTEPVPVFPTAHYAMGGVPTNVDGEVLANNDDTVPGLYAAGEVACVSVHGANRIGTNSLLDINVFGRRAGIAAAKYAQTVTLPEAAAHPEAAVVSMIDRLRTSTGTERVATIRAALQSTMDRNAQVYRTDSTLTKAKTDIAELTARYANVAIQDKGLRFNSELLEAVELGFLLNLAAVLVDSALARTESRGGHAREDYPDRDDANFLQHTMAYRMDDGGIRLDYKPVVITRYQPTGLGVLMAAARTVEVKIRRFNPETDTDPHWQTFRVESQPGDRVLNLLHNIKWYADGTLNFRRSCAQGSCGSDAVRINGVNRLACKMLVRDLPDKITIEPIKGLPVLKDLIVDMEPFFEAYRAVQPYLMTDDHEPTRERHQSPSERERFEDTSKCILCAACTTSCPVFWTDGSYFGPAAIVNAHRFIFDNRDGAAEERLEILNDREGVWRCRTTFNCTDACPQGIQVTKAIQEVKRALLFRRV